MKNIKEQLEDACNDHFNDDLTQAKKMEFRHGDSGSWFDAIEYHPQIGDKIEFETKNGLTVIGECVNRHSVGAYWAMNWGYFYDENVVRWRLSNCH